MNPRVHRGDLDDVSDDEYEDTDSQVLPAAEPVRGVSATQSTHKRSE